MSLKIGDKLWYVPHDYRRGYGELPGYEVTVAKIGRRWATLEGADYHSDRINLSDWTADGGGYSSPGRCYETREAYENATALKSAWEQFVGCLSRQSPAPRADLEWINEAYDRLGLTRPPGNEGI